MCIWLIYKSCWSFLEEYQIVRSVVRSCEKCQSIDPAPVWWQKGRLSVHEVWSQLGMDITHYNGHHFLIPINCGPMWFSIWWPQVLQDAAHIIWQLESVFFNVAPQCSSWLIMTLLMHSVIQTAYEWMGHQILTILHIQAVWKWYYRWVSPDSKMNCCVEGLSYYRGHVLA